MQTDSARKRYKRAAMVLKPQFFYKKLNTCCKKMNNTQEGK